MKMIKVYNKILAKIDVLKDVPPLFFRLILAYGFFGPAMMKLKNFDNIVEWFSGMGMLFPTLNAYMVTATETAGFIFLFLGLATRLISVPLIVVMLVAIFSVHLDGGFEAGNNGFEIPLYYLLMLFSLIVTGPGKLSVDAIISKYCKN